MAWALFSWWSVGIGCVMSVSSQFARLTTSDQRDAGAHGRNLDSDRTICRSV